MERKEQARAKAGLRRQARLERAVASKLMKHGLVSLSAEDITVIFKKLGFDDSVVEAVRDNHVGGSEISGCLDQHDFTRLVASPLALGHTSDPFQKLMKEVATTLNEAAKKRGYTTDCLNRKVLERKLARAARAVRMKCQTDGFAKLTTEDIAVIFEHWGFESLVPTVTSDNIDGNKIIKCKDIDAFAK